jgi:DMSO/TMAO reductase YedYZ molybdopterin-dependent catalytic subunit/thiosulfate reductase cytochrome b subunit
MKARQSPQRRDPLEARLTKAGASIRSDAWLPPQWGEVPRIRLGKRWINVLWVIPLAFVVLVLGIAVRQGLYETRWFQQFLVRYPGIPESALAVHTGYPLWLRVEHFLNMLFMFFIIRAGIQILADHPRLYWNRDCTPETDWFRFLHSVPRDRVWVSKYEGHGRVVRTLDVLVPTDQVWTSKSDSVTIPKWLGIPGIRHSVGPARWWHFSVNLLWVLNGTAFYGMLFATDQWQRLVPTTWAVFPNALSIVIQYWSLHFPVDHSWTRYNALQQLTYFLTVFIAAPVQIGTGLMQSPAIANKLGWLGRPFNRQRARTVHFFGLLWFVFFILVHGTFVFKTAARSNLNHMWAGVNNNSWEGLWIFAIAAAILIATWFFASPFTIKFARLVQNIGKVMVGSLKGAAETWSPTIQYTEQDISPHFWANGTLPVSEEFKALEEDGFASYRLRVDGLVENPREFSYAELKALPKQEQITEHFCIQGWSGVAKWGGVQMRQILDIVKPTAEARYAVFYSFADGADGGIYYDVHNMRNMRHELTILAYEMNGSALPLLHGAPLRLRCENELGFKMVKWIQAIEFVRDYAQLGSGQGGYNEDHEFYGNRMSI